MSDDPANGRKLSLWYMLAVLCAIVSIFTLPLLWFGTLGLRGRLIDAGNEENIRAGIILLTFGLLPIVLTAIFGALDYQSAK